MQHAISLGTVIDKRYQVQKKIPDTTNNSCYLAEDTDQSNRLVVISFPRMELQTLPGFVSTFEDACQRLMKARLNGLVKILDCGEFESQPYAVLQYVTDDTLEYALKSRKNRQKKLSIDEVLDWARPLAVTLDELHELDYVHSNVRPSTIYLGQKQQILLGDFITELTIQRLGAFKQAISSLDIADHLAPEYIKSNYNESYDQYLLATIIYEALAGRSHFHNPGSSEAYRRQVATKFPEPLLTHRPDLVGASRILSKALERNPVKRFDTCRGFIDQLGSVQVNPVFAHPDGKPVTVIKKVLDLDETLPAEPIITSIRSERNAGRKKGFLWLGVLLLGTGAGAYAVNHFGGFEQFKTKLTTTLNEFSKETKPPVIVPVDTSNTIGEQAVSTESPADISSAANNETAKETQVLSSTDASQQSTSASNAATDVSQNAKRMDVEEPIKSTLIDNKNNTDEIQLSEMPKDSVDTFPGIESDVQEAGEPVNVADNLESNGTLTTAVSQALSEGHEEFTAAQSGKNVEEVGTSVNKIDEAISLALQQGEVDFRQADTLAKSEEQIPPDSEGNSASMDPDDETEVVQDVEVDSEVIDTEKLNAQIIAANKLADEQAKLERERKEREKRAKEQAATQKKVEDALSNVVGTADEAAKKSALEEMKQERARIQALKAQQVARINSITKDCVTSGKIHRQVVAGNLPYLKNCLSVGVDPNLTQSNNWSLLHLASVGGYLNIAKLLVAKGADVNAKSADGKTPLDMATEQEQKKLINYLRSRGGVTNQ